MSKLDASQASDMTERSIGMLVLLCIVTLGFYWFYLAYQWSKEINGLAGREKYNPLLVLLVSIFTCGLGGLVFESLFAFDVAEATAARGIPGRLEQLPMWVIVCNIGACLLGFTAVGIIVSIPAGILATALVQKELNRLAVALHS